MRNDCKQKIRVVLMSSAASNCGNAASEHAFLNWSGLAEGKRYLIKELNIAASGKTLLRLVFASEAWRL
ncbi:MAG: hypothetical protein ACLRSW_12620 [Christensenellaceae bacterium]